MRTRPPQAEELQLVAGTILFEQWKLVRELGRGGFGAVFEARELKLEETQAVKVLYPSMVTRDESLKRFRREVRAMRKLSHAHIGRVFDYREDREQDLALISMELVPGGTLRHLLELARSQGQSVPIRLAGVILEQVLEALVEAHRQKVMHRDVAPGNVLLSGGTPEDLIAASEPDPGVKLVDFGIAGLLETRVASGERTLPGRGLGTVAYMAPEVVASEEVTPAADVYGTGAVIYELLTGEPPLGRFEVPSRLRPSISRALDRFLMDCLERRPDQRPSAEEALARCRLLLRPGITGGNGQDSVTQTGSVPLIGHGGEDAGRSVSDVELSTSSLEIVEPPNEAEVSDRSDKPAGPAAWRPYALAAAALVMFLLGVLVDDLVSIRGPEPAAQVAELESGAGSPGPPPGVPENLSAEIEEADPSTSGEASGRELPAEEDPEVDSPDLLGGVAPEPQGVGTNGHGTNGHGTNGHGIRGHGVSRVDLNRHGTKVSPPAAADSRLATLTVTSEPPGAVVYRGNFGDLLGQAPFTTLLAGGNHPLLAKKSGCRDSHESLTLVPGEPRHLEFVLDCPTRRVLLGSIARPSETVPSGSGAAWPPVAPFIEERLGIQFVFIRRGEFLMGSPSREVGRGDGETLHSVLLTRAYWISETEITQGQWRELMGENPSHFQACGDSCPVENVSWFDVLRFANRLSRESGFSECYQWHECSEAGGSDCRRVTFVGLDCNGYRLPIEAEWEYAARAGRPGPPDFERLDRIGWHLGNSDLRSHPVGQLAANPWGVRDMLGNVSEWVWDVRQRLPGKAVTDPLGPPGEPGAARVIRGGGFDGTAVGRGWLAFRAASRESKEPGSQRPNVGFRLVRTAN